MPKQPQPNRKKADLQIKVHPECSTLAGGGNTSPAKVKFEKGGQGGQSGSVGLLVPREYEEMKGMEGVRAIKGSQGIKGVEVMQGIQGVQEGIKEDEG